MQPVSDWYGNSIRIYLTKCEKLKWSGEPFEVQYFIKFSRVNESVKDIDKSGIPVLTINREMSMIGPFESHQSMVQFLKNAHDRLCGWYGYFEEWMLLRMLSHNDLDKNVTVDPLDAEAALEAITSGVPTLVKVCTSKDNELFCEDFEIQHEKMRLSDPFYGGEPEYRKNNN